ncbi:NAD(P)H-hydrate epimerase [Sulfobacillus thermosulfidooxidans]|uniref:NAD(P)H-hydrate epimerase n=1 Tax=Sulfobacillus thermosulfidooxidans TaxID=28034 RepID=UPI00096BC761|nr:NAD(P)H-hydrate epimerase [Sulfobacillus thermosulfidooxidans]OLZ09177.1 NAD(P)H-hydrate epimerase [Sulfobacillus thermosulfidooxidans]OLZ17742.1 NAD(P)H-hydrate epimerase [Sulfobacillus thermosulfidooxidans]OLZ22287.1 NAD(P)H-hydrate epimerase [Sulfobacillus thermosulfidooxidans]
MAEGTRYYTWAMTQWIPAITSHEMQDVDEALFKLGYDLRQLMENAGAAMAYLAARYLHENLAGKKIAVLCGHGHNGGGGMVAARRLHIYGAQPEVVVPAGTLKPVTWHQRRLLENMGVRVSQLSCVDEQSWQTIIGADLVIDALVGYGLKGPLSGVVADMVNHVGTMSCPVISLDVPSGLSSDGEILNGAIIKATATMTLALPKKGLVMPQAQGYVGDLYLADIGVPGELYRQMGWSMAPIFNGSPYIPLTDTKTGEEGDR